MPNGRDKRQTKAQKRRSKFAKLDRRKCWNKCGGNGPHFVPPSLGERGFYICTPKEES